MKKILLLCLVACFALGGGKTFAQAVPNGGFETWNSTSYNNPNGWFNGNDKTMNRMGIAPVSRVTGQSGYYAIHIQTYTSNGDTSDSYIDNSPDDPTKGIGGVPYSQQPTAFTGYYRYNIMSGDTGGMLVFFKKSGVIISPNLFHITGSQNTWTAFSFPVSVPTAPDTLIIAAVSSNLISGVGIQNGSWLELDGLGFTGASQTIPDGGFENWAAMTYATPAGWEVQGDSISKTTDHYAGTYAVRLKTSLSQDGMVNPSGITTGHHTHNGPPVGGQPYTRTSDSLMGYYKYLPSGTDSANIFVNLTKNGSNIGGNGNFLLPAANYTYFQIPIMAGSTPDTIRIDAYSSTSYNVMANVGSTLYLDALSLKSQTTGIVEATNNNLEIIVYPNPANNVLNITFKRSMEGSAAFRIYDVSGRLVKEDFLKNIVALERIQINVADLSMGVYHYQVSSDEGVIWNKFVKD